jgi:ABC-type Zn2+ transport system substrate-binding protein/surface adhesin
MRPLQVNPDNKPGANELSTILEHLEDEDARNQEA